MHDRLNIPLTHSQPRRTVGVVGTLGFLAMAIMLGFFVYRFCLYRTTALPWPQEATSAVRLIKSPSTLHLVNQHFTNLPALHGAPWTVGESFAWTKREYVVYLNDDQEAIGFLLDGPLSVSSQMLQSLGLQQQTSGRKTLIYRTGSQTTSPERFSVPALTLPWYQGVYWVKDNQNIKSVPFSFTRRGIRLPVRVSLKEETFAETTLDQSTATYLSVHVSPQLAQQLLPEHVPLTFPGFSELLPVLRANGFDLSYGEDKEGGAFIVATAGAQLSLESLGSIAREGLQVANLSTVDSTLPDLSHNEELRSDSAIEITASTENGLDVVSAKNEKNDISRLTQSEDILIYSNRPPVISPEMAQKSSCLARAPWFIRPGELVQLH